VKCQSTAFFDRETGLILVQYQHQQNSSFKGGAKGTPIILQLTKGQSPTKLRTIGKGLLKYLNIKPNLTDLS